MCVSKAKDRRGDRPHHRIEGIRVSLTGQQPGVTIVSTPCCDPSLDDTDRWKAPRVLLSSRTRRILYLQGLAFLFSTA